MQKQVIKSLSKVLTKDTISKCLIKTEYAIRGAIVDAANKIQADMKGGVKKDFSKLLFCNIGNPLPLGQPAFTFDREVLACALHPVLLKSDSISKDAKDRVQMYLSNIEYPHALGAYTQSPGLPFVLNSVKKYIEERDGYPCSTNNLYLTNGASEGVSSMFTAMFKDPNDAVMIPIPQYPLYSALIDLMNGKSVPYYLDESKGWALDMKDLAANYEKGVKDGLKIKGLVVINPGNPTGQVMTKENLVDLAKFAYEKRLVLCADEVYQKNIYCDKKFVSMKKVIMDLGEPYSNMELVSYHSVSKGMMGECGLRGGYMELINFDPYVQSMIAKLRTIGLCSNTVGQMAVELMVNPPKEGVNSPEVVAQYKKEHDMIFGGLKSRAKLLYSKLNKIDHITSNECEGAMYSFPRVHLTDSAVKAAKARGLAPDTMYCLDCLEKTGMLLVSGSGFLQKPGTYHFRITNLIFKNDEFEQALESLEKFNKEFFKKYPQSDFTKHTYKL